MTNVSTDSPPPVNHIFVDFENVHEVDLAVFGSKAVSLTLLIGPRQTKLDVSLVEKLLAHAASVQLVRLASPGRNALDFILTYYVGRAVAADPTGYFHVVSKDTGFDPLIEHLQSKHINARRHDSFATLPFAASAKTLDPIPPLTAPMPRPPSKPKTLLPILDEQVAHVAEHLRKLSTARPRTPKKLVSFLLAHFNQKITEGEASNLVERLSQGDHLAIGEKGTITYNLQPK